MESKREREREIGGRGREEGIEGGVEGEEMRRKRRGGDGGGEEEVVEGRRREESNVSANIEIFRNLKNND